MINHKEPSPRGRLRLFQTKVLRSPFPKADTKPPPPPPRTLDLDTLPQIWMGTIFLCCMPVCPFYKNLSQSCDHRRGRLSIREYTMPCNRNFSGMRAISLHPCLGDACSEGRIRAVWAHLVYPGIYPKDATRYLSPGVSVNNLHYYRALQV